MAFVGERQKIRAEEKKLKDAQNQLAQQESKRPEDLEADWQAKAKIVRKSHDIIHFSINTTLTAT